MPQAETRNFNLDILRSCGLFLIILAHCEPPDWLFQLRNFDVPLMVIISAATFAMLYRNKTLDYKKFYTKRTKQLILPAWYFLTFFFLSIFIGSLIAHTPYPFSTHEITTSYLFYSGIGYVWILRIFLFIAILTPPLLYFEKKADSNYIYFSLVAISYALYEIITFYVLNTLPEGNIPNFLNTVILPIVPYAVLYAYGLKLEELSNKALITISFIAVTIFTSLAFYYYYKVGVIVGTQDMKYPPQLYYLSYAIFGTNTLYLLIKYLYPKDLIKGVWTWISTNSLWIYLWHIYAIFIWNIFFNSPEKDFVTSIEKFLFICAFAILATKMQSCLTPKIKVYLK